MSLGNQFLSEMDLADLEQEFAKVRKAIAELDRKSNPAELARLQNAQRNLEHAIKEYRK